MTDKRNTKNVKKQYRKIIRLSEKEKIRMISVFELKGTKSDFARLYRANRQSVQRILSNGFGEERIISSMKEYCKKQ